MSSPEEVTVPTQAEHEREIFAQFIGLIGAVTGLKSLIEVATVFFREQSGCEAVGLRLVDGDDFPYYEARGLPAAFVLAENSLCSHGPCGEVLRDAAGQPLLDCICGNVICGRFDPSKSFYTAGGTFWTNSTSQLLAGTTEAELKARTRNRCNGEGYESVALFPLRGNGGRRLGLLQFNDRRAGCFTVEEIALWEKLSGYLAVAIARAQADDSLRASEERYRLVAETMVQGVVHHDAEGRIIAVNAAAERILGKSRQELLGSYPVEEEVKRIHEDGSPLPWIDHPVMDALRTGKQVHRAIIGVFNPQLNEHRWLRVDALPVLHDGETQPWGVCSVFEDVTEHKRAEEELRKSEERFRILVEKAPDAIVVHDLDIGRWVEANGNAERLFGMSREELLKSGPLRFYSPCQPDGRPPEESKRDNEARALAGEEVVFERAIRNGAGKDMICEVRLVRLPSSHRRLLRGSLVDITARKAAERELRKTNEELVRLGNELRVNNEQLEQRVLERTARLRALAGELSRSEERERRRIAKIVHDDLQQLLVGARMHLGAMQSHKSVELRRKSLTEAEELIEEAISVARDLTHDLSLVVLHEEGLVSALEWLARWMEQHHGLRVHLKADAVAKPMDECVAVALFQSVRELLFNVVKHAGVKSADVRICRAKEGRMEIVVSDEGKGFDPAQPRTGQAKRSGFGLFSILERLHLLGGRMEMESAPHGGSRFRLVAPLREGQ